MTRSIHDNQVLGYSVDVEAKRLTVRTEYRGRGEPFESTDIRFNGVLGYYVQDSLGGILLDVEQVEFEHLLESYSNLFESGAPHAWPFQGCSSNPSAFVKSAGASSFMIQSSIGFDGFVVCESMVIEAAQPGSAADRARRDR